MALIPRPCQTICIQRACDENIIAVLPTNFGKTLVAVKAIDHFHNKTTLPRMNNPLRVQPAEGEQGTGVVEPKLFVGMIPPAADEAAIEALFSPHGAIEEVFVMRHRNSLQSKGF